MLQNNLEANQVKIGEALSPSPLNPVVDGAYLGTSKMLAPAGDVGVQFFLGGSLDVNIQSSYQWKF